jgi:hypothetical protein
MNNRINTICKVEVARRSEVAYFYETPTGLALVSAPWAQIPLARNASMSISKTPTPAGYRYDVDFEANLSQAWLTRELCLVRVFFDDGSEPMIIGSMDFPVRFAESHALKGKSLQFAHANTHYPYRIQDYTESGSSSVSSGV